MGLIFTTLILLLALPLIICAFCTIICLVIGLSRNTQHVVDTTGRNEAGKAWTINQFFGIKLW